jgi:hypothetical protein
MGKTFTTSKFHIVPACLNFISFKQAQEQGRKESTRTMDKERTN